MSRLFTNPLKKKYPFGYKFGDKTFYGVSHKGIDFICPTGTRLYSIMDGVCYKRYGYQGGNQIWQWSEDKRVLVRYMHLSEYDNSYNGRRKASEFIGKTGNTGVFTTAPHLHLDIKIDGKYVDPLNYIYLTNYLKNMTEKQFKNFMRGYIKKDNRLRQAKDGSVWIVGKNKRFKFPANQSLLASFLVSGWLTEKEEALPITKKQTDVL